MSSVAAKALAPAGCFGPGLPASRRRALACAAAVAVRMALALVLLGISLGLAAAAPKFPALSGRIVDEANLLSAEDRRTLEAELQALEEKSSDQLVIYTAPSLQGYEIEDFGYQLGRAWQIGQKGQDNGIVLIVAPNERKVRIEVGRGLEPQLTDVMSKLIVENAILPAFRRGDFAAGIKAGVRDIRDVVLGDAEAVKARARAGAKREGGGSGLSPALLFLIFFIVMALVLVQTDARQTAHPQRVGGRNRRAPPGPIIIPGSWGGGSGSWGGSGGGGGFSGGGGSFGGGGASGSW